MGDYQGGYVYKNQRYVVCKGARGGGKFYSLVYYEKYIQYLGEYIRLRLKYPYWDILGYWHPIKHRFSVK